MDVSHPQLVAVLVGASFAAGLNVYATLATLGFLARTEVIQLPPELQVLTSWTVIAAAAAMFVVEFFADKIPAFDLIWNALHTFVRIPVAALLAWLAAADLGVAGQAASALAAGTVALAAHGGKTAVRAAVTPSPEPFSNIGLSLGEDLVAVFLAWFAFEHPYLAAGIVVLLLIALLFVLRWVIRSMRALFRGARRQFRQSPETGTW